MAFTRVVITVGDSQKSMKSVCSGILVHRRKKLWYNALLSPAHTFIEAASQSRTITESRSVPPQQ